MERRPEADSLYAAPQERQQPWNWCTRSLQCDARKGSDHRGSPQRFFGSIEDLLLVELNVMLER
jgi:hypothetical protein